MVAESVDAQNFIDSVLNLSYDANLVSWNDIPILDTVLRFYGFNLRVPERCSLVPMPIVAEEMPKTASQ